MMDEDNENWKSFENTMVVTRLSKHVWLCHCSIRSLLTDILLIQQ